MVKERWRSRGVGTLAASEIQGRLHHAASATYAPMASAHACCRSACTSHTYSVSIHIERILVRSVSTSGGSPRLGTFHLINIHRRSTIKQPLKVHLRQLFLDCIHDVERWFCAIIEDAAQGRCRFSDELREVLLVEVLVLHDLSDSVFHHYV